MLVLGIDPGTHRLGWAIVDGNGSKQKAIAHGCLNLKSGTPKEVYLPRIHQLLTEIFAKYQVESLGLETLLFQKNLKTAVTVAQARGVIILAATQAGVPIVELAPNTVKSAVAGHGSASKPEVVRMVGLLLGVDTTHLLDDECDALAVAMTTLITYKN